MSLDIKDVIQLAKAQFKDLLPELSIYAIDAAVPKKKRGTGPITRPPLSPGEIESDIRLEEIEKEGEDWAVTFSVPNPNYGPSALLDGIRSARVLARIAKVVVIDGEEGKLLALRERAA
jgi:hypothetical protein